MVIGSLLCPYISRATPYISSLTRSLSSLRVTWFTTGTSRRHYSTSLALVSRGRERGGKERKRGRQRGTRFVHVKFQDNVFIYFYYFISGYICEEHDNPADFLLDVINQCEGQTSATAGNTAVYPQYLT